MAYTCPYHRYQGDTPCDACEADPARTDEDAQHALTVQDASEELSPRDVRRLLRQIYELTSKDAVQQA